MATEPAPESGRRKTMIVSILTLVVVVLLLFFGTAWLGKRTRSPADLLPGQDLPQTDTRRGWPTDMKVERPKGPTNTKR